MSLVSRKWLLLERSTRTRLSLRGNVRDLYMLPYSFRAVTHLDLSLLSPYGHPLSPSDEHEHEHEHDDDLPLRLHLHFPLLVSLALYARSPDPLLRLLSPLLPSLRRLSLVRWHQRRPSDPSDSSSDFHSLLLHSPSLQHLHLSRFYSWPEDLPSAITSLSYANPNLTHLDLLSTSTFEGFKSHEILTIASAFPNLQRFLAVCTFDPRYIDFVGDDALLALSASCSRLTLLHLADPLSLSGLRGDPEDDGFAGEDARITVVALEEVFRRLTLLEELVLDVGQNVRDSCLALEALSSKCLGLKSLKLGHFHGVCSGVTSKLDGVAVCKGLECLALRSCGDLTDSGLMAIALGCPGLTKFEVHGCKRITEVGLRNLAFVLSKTLVDVKVSCCKQLDARAALRALEPVRTRVRRLHIDCVWRSVALPVLNFSNHEDDELGENEIYGDQCFISCCPTNNKRNSTIFEANSMNKKMRHCLSIEEEECSSSSSSSSSSSNGSQQMNTKSWDRLEYLSLWSEVGDLLTPLHLMGLEVCPLLEETKIRIEGDCRGRPRPIDVAYGLSCLARYPRLSKMQLDCRDAVGYALTAPPGEMDLSLWDRFFLNGIGSLSLYELDYWPPQDRDVNQRSLSLPAAGLLAQCSTLRKLFIHGTAYEHFLMMLLRIPDLRDVQLREDYYPAPEDDMSTEVRATSCRRFEDALNRRMIND
ncbi:hypothetical protein Sjap_000519 [Stephania japonica]|uniref:Uncharacterized protein n=1 Tax=Stephania japonica TaxID=461633 RepID=A0AAP0PSJ8_9MAGN